MGKGGFKYVFGSADIYLVIVTVWHVQLSECSGKMLNNIYPVHTFFYNLRIGNTSYNDFCSP